MAVVRPTIDHAVPAQPARLAFRMLKRTLASPLRIAKRGAFYFVRRLTRLFPRWPFASSAYYAFASDAFHREHTAVLAGRHRYVEQESSGRQRYLLRRNIHMLEKGLVMRPRRGVFALDYIAGTVATYQALLCDANFDCSVDEELQWANDVLAAYFETAGTHPVVDGARAEFTRSAPGSDRRSPTPGLCPYQRDLSKPPPVAYENLFALARLRRSVRWFESKAVPRRLIDQALAVAGLSPSACNRQPFQFRVIDEPELVGKVAGIPMGTRGYAENIPVFVVIVGDLSAFFSERDRHLIYTDGCLAAMSFVFALETLGLSSCCINWPDIAEREAAMAEFLRLRPHERPIMCVAVGYPDRQGMVPFSQKKSLNQLRRYNFE